METIIQKHWYRTDKFEPVKDFPHGYFVWNIGRRNFPYEKCVPLAKYGVNEEPWQMNVDLDTLKYIKVKTEDLALRILKAAGKDIVGKDRFYEIIK